MRINAALILALMLVLSDVRTSLADAQEPQQHDRNPIVWLLSDIGKLLESSVSAVIQKPVVENTQHPAAAKPEDAPKKPIVAASAAESVKSADAQPEKTSILSIFDDLANLFTQAKSNAAALKKVDVVADQSPASPEITPTAPVSDNKTKPAMAATDPAIAEAPKKFRNPITWLLSDLSRLLQPTLEIDNQPVTVAAVEEKPEPIQAEVLPITASVQPPEAVNAEPVTTAVPAEAPLLPSAVKPSAKLLNPLEWLIRDLASLITPAQPLASAEKTVNSETPETAVVASAADVPHISPDDIDLSGTSTMATAELAANAPVAEVGPWVPRPKGNLFDPNDSLFGSTGTPLMAHTVVATPSPPTEIAAVRKQPVIRERLTDHPEIRNYGSLGYDPRSINKKTDDDQGFIGNVLEQILGTDPQDVATSDGGEPLANKIADTIVPEEKLDLGYISPDAKPQGLELTRIGEGPLTDIDLYLGNKITIGTAYNAAEFKHDSCIERSLHGSIFCLKSLEWPAEISKSFSTDTAYVMPGEGVVRYENGTSSRIYAVFNAADFAQIVKYMQHRFGPPQEREIGWMHMLEAPRMPNTTFRWQAFSPDRREIINLEVRNYDDLRRSFADLDHGMVRLYRSGSRPIFKHISTMDLMLMQRRRLASTTVEANQPPKQQ
ncbi:MAG: hypothetical protein NWR87_03895 [Rhodospirillales bacterium]|nr:hypothetical protein [Rhodospirillales bacterium]